MVTPNRESILFLLLLTSSCAMAGYLGIDYTEKAGRVVLTKIDRKSPAEYYGLKVGDVILTDLSPDEFIASIRSAPPGHILTFRAKTPNGTETFHVPLSSGPGASFPKDIMQAD